MDNGKRPEAVASIRCIVRQHNDLAKRVLSGKKAGVPKTSEDGSDGVRVPASIAERTDFGAAGAPNLVLRGRLGSSLLFLSPKRISPEVIVPGIRLPDRGGHKLRDVLGRPLRFRAIPKRDSIRTAVLELERDRQLAGGAAWSGRLIPLSQAPQHSFRQVRT